MNDKQQYKIGDKIVDYGQVYRIFKIKKDKTFNGEKENWIFYKPYFKTDKNKSLICSIPESSVEESNIRKPATKKKINKTLRLLDQEPNGEAKISVKEASTYLKENDPIETARLLTFLWLEKQNEEKKLNTKKKRLYQNAIKCLAEEIAVVQSIGLKKARRKIVRRLKKICPERKGEENDQ